MGDRIIDFILEKMPRLVQWVGGMSEWQVIAFAAVLLVLAYTIYAALVGIWSIAVESHNDTEPYEAWMDYDAWGRS